LNEKIVTVCSFCKRVCDGNKWVSKDVEKDIRLSHGVCPECAEKHYGKWYKKREEK
jgi:hypothetical protein